jgi:hypothetical protein
MNLKDEFWFWITKAITKPSKSDIRFFFDNADKKLFALMNDFDPFFRNNYTKNNKKTFNEFLLKISKVKNNYDGVIELKSIEYSEKKGF